MQITAEFTGNRSEAFQKFLDEAKQIPGYYQKTDAAGRVAYAIDFTERTYSRILDGFGQRLEYRWGGVFRVNGRSMSLAGVWRRHLRSEVAARTSCPACGLRLSSFRLEPYFIFIEDGSIDYAVSCLCGADITDI